MVGQITTENNNQDGLNCATQVVVVMVPFPAQGHLNQLLHLSHRIASFGLPVHYAGSATHNRQAKVRLQGWDSGKGSGGNDIHFHDFELPPYESPPPNPNLSMHFPAHLQPCWNACMHLREPVCQLLQQLAVKYRRVVVIFDTLMASVVRDVKMIENAEAYKFLPCSAFTIFLGRYDRMNHKLPFDQLDSNDIPNKIPSNEGCFTPELHGFIAEIEKHSGFESGSLCDTSRVIEGRYVELLEKLSNKKCFAVGPFNPLYIAKQRSEKSTHYCLEWLDKQEKDSVIYVSFGSTISLIHEQVEELALGLENSEQKFVWVLREADKADVFDETGANSGPQLPEGFEERVKGRGIVVKEWAPQLEILAHASVGGFMTHCGWNSCLESISLGVAMATWPRHSDQPRNAALVTEVLKIGTSVMDWENHGELVRSNAIEDAVRRLIASEEGKGMRERSAELGDAVRKSAASGGSSRLEMEAFVATITR